MSAAKLVVGGHGLKEQVCHPLTFVNLFGSTPNFELQV